MATGLSAMLTPADIAAIEAALAASPAAVLPVTLPESGRVVWAKRASAAKANGWHRAQAMLGRVLPIPLLTVTVNPGGAEALAQEARRLEAVRARRGVATPRVLHAAPGYLVLEDRGRPVLDCLRDAAAGDAARAVVLAAAARTLRTLHDRGGWHGRPAFRDFLWNGAEITLIDLEEELEPALSLPQRQARDVLLFWHAAARFGTEGMKAAADAYGLAFCPAEVSAALRRMLPWLRAFRCMLAPFRRRGGRDLRQAFAAVDFLCHYSG